MGAWGMGILQDDSAADFLEELCEAEDPLSLMKGAFVSASAAKYLEYDSAHQVLVSAAALDALLNGTHYGSGEELDAWVKRNRGLNVGALKGPAVAAVRRVLAGGSELNELWLENAKDYPTWRAGVELIAGRLEA